MARIYNTDDNWLWYAIRMSLDVCGNKSVARTTDGGAAEKLAQAAAITSEAHESTPVDEEAMARNVVVAQGA